MEINKDKIDFFGLIADGCDIRTDSDGCIEVLSPKMWQKEIRGAEDIKQSRQDWMRIWEMDTDE